MPFRAADSRRRGGRPRRRAQTALRQATAPLAEPLEERVLMAAAVKLGKSGYSGTLSTDPVTRQQQLICDPVEPAAGSTSVAYDPTLVRLTGFQPGPGYALQAFVEVKDPQKPGSTLLVTFTDYLRQQLVGTGYVQVKYQLDPTKDAPGQITPPRTNVILDEEGVDGVDTHALLFQPMKETTSDPQIKYRVFAAGPNTHSGNSPDFLVINDGTSNTITFDELEPADITPVPELGSISGRVLEDTTDDGLETADDKPIEKATVFLDLNHDGKLDTTKEPTAETDENGNFLFEGLKPDVYDVLPVAPSGFFKSASYPKELPIKATVVAGRRFRGADFGFSRPASLSGTVYADRDGDGVRDVGEPGLPGTTVFIDANNNGAFDTGERSAKTDATGAWLIGSLRTGTYTVRFTPPAGYTKTAPGGTAGFAYTRTLNPGDNPNNLVFGARGIADLTIAKTDGQTSAVPGQAITYTVTVTNTLLAGAPTATVVDARVLDTLPAVLSNVTWTAAFTGTGSVGNASGSGNTIDELITLGPGGTAVYTVTGTLVSFVVGSSLTNTATVTAPATVVETITANNSATDTDTLTPQADLRVTLTDAPDPVYPNGLITYNVTVANLGPSDAQNVAVMDTLPAGTTFVSAVAPLGWVTTSPVGGGTGTVRFTNTSVGAQTSFGFNITVRLDPSVAPGTLIQDSASASTTTTDPVPANNSAATNTLVVAQPPRVTRVFVNGTTWPAAFRSYLVANGLADAAFGFDVGSGAPSQLALPWANLNQVSLRFDLPANVGPADLAVRGTNVLTYGSSAFNYDPATNTATWTLSRAIPLDRVILDLNGDAGGVTEFTGQSLLDGESANNALPSGNGAPGGDFRFRLNVLPADVDRNGRVDAFDTLGVRARQGSNTTTNPTNYSALFDFDTNGRIDAFDTLGVRAKQGTSLTGVALPTSAPLGLAAPATESLFSASPIAATRDQDELAALLA